MTVLWSMECSRTHPQLLLHTSGSCAVRTPCVSSCPFFSILTSAVFPLALDSSAVSHLVLLPPLPAPLKPTQNNFFFVYLAASGQLRHMGSLLYYAEFFIAVHRLSCSTGMWDLSARLCAVYLIYLTTSLNISLHEGYYPYFTQEET